MNDSMRLDWLQNEAASVVGRTARGGAFQVHGKPRPNHAAAAAVDTWSLRRCIDCAASHTRRVRTRPLQEDDRRRMTWLTTRCRELTRGITGRWWITFGKGDGIPEFDNKTIRGVIDKAMRAPRSRMRSHKMNDTMRLDWIQKYAIHVRGRGRIPSKYAFELTGYSRKFEMTASAVSETSPRDCIDLVISRLPDRLRYRPPQPGDRRRLDWLADHCGLLFSDAFSGSRRMYFGGIGFVGFVEARTIRGVIDKAMKAIQREKRKMRTGKGY